MVAAAGARSSTLPALSLPRLRRIVGAVGSRWSGQAWGAIALTAAFIGITCWWLTQDRSIPIYDAGLHLAFAIQVHQELAAGHLLKALTLTHPYPPLVYLMGALGITIGGVSVAAPIVIENVVFVSLLALGCYKVARLAFGPTAGLLAVVFALGSPLITAQFHVFMTDAPETALVAVSVWLILATEGFSRLKGCALAGVAVGLGMLVKEPFPIFVVGVVLVTVVRGGRRSWRGLLVFAVVALAIALPWYVHEYSQLDVVKTEATATATSFAGSPTASVAPPRLSLINLQWYFWNLVNDQLYLPLLLLAMGGWVWALLGWLRRRPVSRYTPELVVGAFVGWAILTETYLHDTRYSMPLLVYLAVFGVGWIVRLGGRARIAAIVLLALAATVNTLGASFGVGAQTRVTLAGSNEYQEAGTLTIAENHGFLVSGPQRDGDLLGMLRGLRRSGVRQVGWFENEAYAPDFSESGVQSLLLVAGLYQLPEAVQLASLSRLDAILLHEAPRRGLPPPCAMLADGTGVWVRLGNALGAGGRYFCPRPKPHLYS